MERTLETVSQRRLFFDLVDVLLECADPHSVAQALLLSILEDIDELRVEIEEFLNDLVALADAESCPLPEEQVQLVRSDLEEMQAQQTRLGVLFSVETRACGVAAVPILVGAIMSANNWVEFASDFLDSAERLRIRADAVLCRLPGDRRRVRQGIRASLDTPARSRDVR